MWTCRACLANIAHEAITLDTYLIESFMTITNLDISPDDHLPQELCTACFAKVYEYINFREMCLLSHETLQKTLIESNIIPTENIDIKVVKIETVDSSDSKLELEETVDMFLEDFDIQAVTKLDTDNDNHKSIEPGEVKIEEEKGLLMNEKTQQIKKQSNIKSMRQETKKQKSKEPKSVNQECTDNEIYLCDECPTRFKTKASLSSHIKSTHTGVRFQCDKCGTSYSKVNKLKTHMGRAHQLQVRKGARLKAHVNYTELRVPAKREFPCGLCSSVLVSAEALYAHVGAHEGESVCGVCEEPCVDWAHLAAHRTAHLPAAAAAAADYTCYKCRKKTYGVVYLEYHIRSAHFDEHNISCKTCGKQYGSARRLLAHERRQHAARRAHLAQLDQLNQQQPSKLPKPAPAADTKLTCDKCTRTYRNAGTLGRHKCQGSRYACVHCGEKFGSANAKRRHVLRVHEPHRRECRLCHRLFDSQQLLDGHACPDAATSVCPHCGKIFHSKKAFDKHRTESHAAGARHVCGKCGAAFRQRANLRAHLDRHAGVRRHRCTHCARAFYAYNVLVKHLRTHTGERPYVCKICSKGFMANHNLKVHMKVHGLDLVKKKVDDEDDGSD